MDTQGEYHYGRSLSTEVLGNIARLYPETRPAVLQALRSLLPPLTEDGELDWPHEYHDDAWSPVVEELGILRDEASRPQVKGLFARGWIDTSFIDEEDYEDDLSGTSSLTIPVRPFDIIETYEALRRQEEADRRNRERDEKGRELATLLQKAGGKIGRNDPCPCGSGKKFKKCHGQPGR